MTKLEFKIAAMSGDIRFLTAILLVLPVVLGIAVVSDEGLLALPVFALVLLLYAVIWFYWRPASFSVTGETLEIIWPLRRRKIPRAGIMSARVVSSGQLKKELGWTVRIGCGGLWGGFGRLWTRKRGVVQMYISTTRDLVWLDCGAERPWLISPSNPAGFVRALFPGTPIPSPVSPLKDEDPET